MSLGERRPSRIAVAALAAGLLAGVAAIAIGVAAPPLSESCSSAVYTADECHLTIDAAMRRGLARVHPLVLRAHAEPGPDRDAGELGHRDTVTFEMLGVPGTTTVRLFYDVGAHWGGEPDRGAVELAAWSLATAGLASLIVAALAGAILRARA